jgi:assimilatory nitrate reductase catalytic subunit
MTNLEGRVIAIPHQAPAEEVDATYPLYLTTGRVLAQYQSGTQTQRVAHLRELAPEPLAESIRPRQGAMGLSMASR